ncbi:MAG: hypothetical protein R3D66_01435 [Alphaproteobacteria bacterium]|nr:hypothetical protein [Alphaproteobacteria bacterium]
MNLSLPRVLILLLANLIGFVSAGVCYTIGQLNGTISIDTIEAFNPHTYITTIMIIWASCALCSLAYFFFEEKIRYLFLLAPVLIPYGYGLSVLFLGLPL